MKKIERITLPTRRWRAVSTTFGSLDAPDELGDFLVAVCHREEKEEREDLMEPVRDELFQLGMAVVMFAVPDPGDPHPQRAMLATDEANWEFITPAGRRILVKEDTLEVVFGGGSMNAAAALLHSCFRVAIDDRFPWETGVTVRTEDGRVFRVFPAVHGAKGAEALMDTLWGTHAPDEIWRLRWANAMEGA